MKLVSPISALSTNLMNPFKRILGGLGLRKSDPISHRKLVAGGPLKSFFSVTWLSVAIFSHGGALSPGADVIISEFLAFSISGIEDEDGENSDWIELMNISDL